MSIIFNNILHTKKSLEVFPKSNPCQINKISPCGSQARQQAWRGFHILLKEPNVAT